MNNDSTTLPRWHETLIPVLDVMQDGSAMFVPEITRKVVSKYYADLPKQDLLSRYETGQLKIENRIGFGISALKIAKMISYEGRGKARKITQKGLTVLRQGNLTPEDLRRDKDYALYYREKQQREQAQGAEDEDTQSNLCIDNSPSDLIEDGISKIKEQVTSYLLDKLKEVDPYKFEHMVLALFRQMGYGEVEGTLKSNDGGIDGIINQDTLGLEKIYVQAKRYADNKVREGDIRSFIGAMSGDTTKGIFVTTSLFHDKAVAKAKNADQKIILIDGGQLVKLMYEYNVGIRVDKTYKTKEIDEDFFDTHSPSEKLLTPKISKLPNKTVDTSVPQSTRPATVNLDQSREWFCLRKSGQNAKIRQDGNTFTVLKGSYINASSVPSFAKGRPELHAFRLKQTSDLQRVGDLLILDQDVSFPVAIPGCQIRSGSGANQAAIFILGRQVNVWDTFKDDAGTTMKNVIKK